MAGGPLYGSMNITLVAAVQETMAAPMTSVLGKFNDGPTPTPAAWQVKSEANGCKLYTPRVLFCDPACERTTQVCVEDDTCATYPKATSVGTIKLTGLGSNELSMDPVANNYQPKAGTTVPHPPCSEGATITLDAAGGAYAPFSIATKCIAPLAFAAALTLEKDKPLKLSWNAPGQAGLAKIGVKLDISHHGGSKGKIECEVDDTGSLEIPAAMVTALIDLGVAGFPTIVLTRKTSAAGSGNAQNVALNITSPVERAITIPGLTSCTDNAECPMGQTCQADLTCK
jgi:hypothetical protein